MNRRLLTVAICLGLIGLTWIVFGQTRSFPFVNYDDPGYVAENPDVTRGLDWPAVRWAFTHSLGGNWHPLTTLSHMVDAKIFGLRNPGSHHLVNVVLHTIAALLLFLVLRSMTGSLWRSAFVAAVFAIHPLRAESVAWISERKDSLSAVFFMLTLGAYVHYARKSTIGNYLLVTFLFALGLMSKPMLVTIPIVLLLLDFWPLQRDRTNKWSKLLMEKIPLFILAAAAGVATFAAQKPALGTVEASPWSWRIGNALVSLWIYIRQMFWPVRLAVFYPHPEDHLPLWEPIGAAILLVAVTWIAIVARRRAPYSLVGWFWYLVMLAPVAGIIQVGLQGHADRFTYLPQIGLGLIVAWGAYDLSARWPFRRLMLTAYAVAAITALVYTARAQVAYWRDSEVLWRHTIAVTKNNDVALTNYSELLLRRKRPKEAVEPALEAIKIRPDNAQAYNNLGVAYMRTGRAELAIWALQKSLELRPEGMNTAMSLAWILATCPYGTLRNGIRAVELAEDVIDRSKTREPYALHTLAAAYAETNRFGEASVVAEEAKQLAEKDGNMALVEELELNVKNYQNSLPLRDPVLVPEDR